MSEQTLVAVYDTAAHAAAAVRDLEAAHVPSNAISSHAQGGTAGGTAGGATTAAPAREQGFWASLFGGDSDDATVYDRSIESGSTVVTVKVPEQHVARVSQMLEAHDPIDFEERAASYGMAQGSAATTATTATTVAPAMAAKAATMPAQAGMNTGMSAGTDEGTIKIVEERLAVGKRAVNRGGMRVRSYVVETPVEEQVSLHSESIHVERRPVTDGRVVTDADFADRSIEMTQTSEEAVVGKTARVVEEIALRKEATDRVETVRDTVRRDEVEVEQIPAAALDVTTTATTTVAATAPATRPATPAAKR